MLRFLVLMAAFAASGCIVAASAYAQEPQWLVEARAREGKLSKPKVLRSADRFMQASVAAKLIGEVAADEDTYQIQLDIGSSAPLNCEVIREGFDPAALLRATAEFTFQQIESHQGTVEQRAVERIDAGVLGGNPFLVVDWIYRVNDGTAPRLGGLKQFALEKDGHGVYCAHVDLGYSKTFFEVVRSLVESIEFSAPAAPPYFAEVHTAALQGRRVGTARMTMTRDEEGDTKVLTTFSILVPVTPDTLRTLDSYDVQWTRPDGSMINASHIAVENGEIQTNLNLSGTEDDGWRVEGLFHGKEISEAIASDRPPGTDLGYSLAKRELLASPEVVGRKVSVLRWLTSADPTRFHEMSTSVVAALEGGQFSAQETAAGITADVVLEKSTGTSISARIPMGPDSIELERVHIEGSF